MTMKKQTIFQKFFVMTSLVIAGVISILALSGGVYAKECATNFVNEGRQVFVELEFENSNYKPQDFINLTDYDAEHKLRGIEFYFEGANDKPYDEQIYDWKSKIFNAYDSGLSTLQFVLEENEGMGGDSTYETTNITANKMQVVVKYSGLNRVEVKLIFYSDAFEVLSETILRASNVIRDKTWFRFVMTTKGNEPFNPNRFETKSDNSLAWKFALYDNLAFDVPFCAPSPGATADDKTSVDFKALALLNQPERLFTKPVKIADAINDKNELVISLNGSELVRYDTDKFIYTATEKEVILVFHTITYESHPQGPTYAIKKTTINLYEYAHGVIKDEPIAKTPNTPIVLNDVSSLSSAKLALHFEKPADNLAPVLDPTVDAYYLTNVNNPILELNIRKQLKAIDEVDGEIPYTAFTIVSDGYSQNKHNIGEYKIIYSVKDSAGNEAQIEITVGVVDIDDPVITGLSEIETTYYQKLSVAEIITKAEIKVSDNYDKNLKAILKEGHLYTPENQGKVGTYDLTFVATDSSENTTEFLVKLTVKDDKKPVLSGKVFYQISYQESLTVAEVQGQLHALDELDGNLTLVLESDNYSENKTKPGKYQMVFSATDKSDNKETITVSIEVKDNVAPVIKLSDSFIKIDGSLNWTKEEIIAHLIKTGELDPETTLSNYQVDPNLTTFTASSNLKSGTYKIVLVKKETAPLDLKDTIEIDVGVVNSEELSGQRHLEMILIPILVAVLACATLSITATVYLKRKKALK